MTTAIEIITDALEEIGYKGSETPIEAADANLALRKLNDMLAEWSGSGILGAEPVKLTSDTVRIPRGAVSGVKMNLAGRLTSPFRVPMTAELAASIKAATQSMLRAIVHIGDVEFPGTLPLGSGSECSDVNRDARFFPQNSDENF